MKESAFTGGTPSSLSEGTVRGYKELKPRNDAERNLCMKTVNARNASIMNGDIQNLRYAFIKLNMTYTGIL